MVGMQSALQIRIVVVWVLGCIGRPSGIGWGDNVRETVGSSPASPRREGGLAAVML